jgi:hypothetical protein
MNNIQELEYKDQENPDFLRIKIPIEKDETNKYNITF